MNRTYFNLIMFAVAFVATLIGGLAAGAALLTGYTLVWWVGSRKDPK